MDALKAMWLRVRAWLRREAYVREVVTETAKNAYLEGHAAGFSDGWQAGYRIGKAHGELMGREALANELQIAHGIEGGERSMTPEDIATLKLRQRH